MITADQPAVVQKTMTSVVPKTLVEKVIEFLKDDSLTVEEVRVVIDIAKTMLAKSYPKHKEDEYAIVLYSSYLLQKSGKTGDITSLSHDGMNTTYNTDHFTSNRYFDLFIQYIDISAYVGQ